MNRHLQMATLIIDTALNEGYEISLTTLDKKRRTPATTNRADLLHNIKSPLVGLHFHKGKKLIGSAIIQYINGQMSVGVDATKTLSNLLDNSVNAFLATQHNYQHSIKHCDTHDDLLDDLEQEALKALKRPFPSYH